ncbi:Isochorismatase hydrolase [Cadophora sp. DSE1049]|nr:Isochorismatase hydrolase [Cadophora sp. DSE1049]
MATQLFNTADPSTPGHYAPSQTAFLLLDFHSAFTDKTGPKAWAAINVAVRMKSWAQSQGIPIIHCLLDISQSPFATCKDAGSAGGEEPEALRGQSENEVTFLRRPGYVSALKSPGLLEYLESKGIKSLILAGLSTSGCVMRTAVAASDEEFVVTVLSDGCMDPVEGLHDVVVGKLLNRGWVATCEEFREGFSARRE